MAKDETQSRSSPARKGHRSASPRKRRKAAISSLTISATFRLWRLRRPFRASRGEAKIERLSKDISFSARDTAFEEGQPDQTEIRKLTNKSKS